MHTLVVFAHPEPHSLTGSTAQSLVDSLVEAGGTAEIADLFGEGFDPRYGDADLKVLRGQAGVPDDIRYEQERIERADSVVLVHPVYWWGLPALLKGWLDRVFTFGWAFGTDEATVLKSKKIHLLGLGGNAPQTYDEHGYRDAIRTTLEHGVFDFVSGPVASSRILHSSAENIGDQVGEVVREIVEDLAVDLAVDVSPVAARG